MTTSPRKRAFLQSAQAIKNVSFKERLLMRENDVCGDPCVKMQDAAAQIIKNYYRELIIKRVFLSIITLGIYLFIAWIKNNHTLKLPYSESISQFNEGYSAYPKKTMKSDNNQQKAIHSQIHSQLKPDNGDNPPNNGDNPAERQTNDLSQRLDRIEEDIAEYNRKKAAFSQDIKELRERLRQNDRVLFDLQQKLNWVATELARQGLTVSFSGEPRTPRPPQRFRS